jgi:hypothetical protein
LARSATIEVGESKNVARGTHRRSVENRYAVPPGKSALDVKLPGLGMVGGGSGRTKPMGRGGRGGGKGGKKELVNSAELKAWLSNVKDRIAFGKWLEKGHKHGEPHVHVDPGSRDMEEKVKQFADEEGIKLNKRTDTGPAPVPVGLSQEEAARGAREHGGVWAAEMGRLGYYWLAKTWNGRDTVVWGDTPPKIEGAVPIYGMPSVLAPPQLPISFGWVSTLFGLGAPLEVMP